MNMFTLWINEQGDKELITAPMDRFQLQTEPAGDVRLRLSVLPKDLARYGVLC